MRSTIRLSESHEQVLQLPEVDLGEHGHRHEAQSSDEGGHVRWDQIDQYEKHNWIMKDFSIFSSGLDVKFFYCCCFLYFASKYCIFILAALSFNVDDPTMVLDLPQQLSQ